jgi:hypothetical protein
MDFEGEIRKILVLGIGYYVLGGGVLSEDA